MFLKNSFFIFAVINLLLTGCLSSKLKDKTVCQDKNKIPINRFNNNKIKIDGYLKDWGKLSCNSVFLQQGSNCFLGEKHLDQDAALLKIAYDDKAFYVAVKVADKSFVPAKTKSELAKGDVVELFLDIRPVNGVNKEQVFRNTKYTQGVYQLRIAAPNENNKITVWAAGNSKEPPEGIEIAGIKTKDGYTIEFKMPFAKMFGKPSAARFKKAIGFEIMLCDVDKNTSPWYYSINRLGGYSQKPQNFCISHQVIDKRKTVGFGMQFSTKDNKEISARQVFLDNEKMPDPEKFVNISCKYESSTFDFPQNHKDKKNERPKFKSAKTKILNYPSLGIKYYKKAMNINNPQSGRYYISCKFGEASDKILKQCFYGVKRAWGGVKLYPVPTPINSQEAMTLAEKSATKHPRGLGYDFFPMKIQLDNNFIFTNAKKLKGTFQPSMLPELLFFLSEYADKNKKEPAPVWGRILIANPNNGKIIRQVELKPLHSENEFELPINGLKKGLYQVYFEFVTAAGTTYAPEMIYYTRGSGVAFNSKVTLGVVEPYEQILKTTLKNSDKLLTKAIYVGNAGKKQFPKDNVADCYARFVRDMQLYKGIIYIGDGDWNRNRGPIDIWSFKPEKGNTKLNFKKEFTVDDESVDLFRIYDDKLLVPGIDAADKPSKGQHQWDFGNLYIKQNGKWAKHRNVPNGIHVLDAAVFKGDIYISTGTESGAAVFKSKDNGKTWVKVDKHMGKAGVRRFYQIIPLKDFLLTTSDNRYDVYKCQDGKIKRLGVPFLPLLKQGNGVIFRINKFKNGAVYTFRAWSKKHIPWRLYWLNDFKQGAKVVECFKDLTVVDIISRDGWCYVMTAQDKDKKLFSASIFKSKNMKDWIKVAKIKNLLARPSSFEYTQDTFYIGLAAGYMDKNVASGNIYKLAY